MASLKDLRNRIASVKATQKITKAMQMVAAAKLRRAQEAAEAARPYAERMDRVLANLATGMTGRSDAPALLAGTGSDQVHLVIVATADRGLCGGFNSSIVRLARQHINKLVGEGKTVKILTVGRKGRDALKRDHASRIVKSYEFTGIRHIGFEQAEDISRTVIDLFEAGEFDVATIFYSKFVNVVSQIPTAQQLIPASVPADAGGSVDLGGAVYEYEPDEGEILKDILPRNLSVQIFRALLENVAGEFGAKMSAMDNATRNAGDMIKKLNITYNRSRQAMITKELIEIISGAEAL
ncbi:ATP synthase F1, gamma subunit [Parvibaculum lavamentivorans DS-1]|uniref:ATP synthase gamma chain n=1 Tax=Parvibaculum lavamentivorans (strain DS-1 / DSM 13023 / NCIMB 13966) TaxID=402881 RepID=ATPG_PARL1|nr:F0F1 ATP synthase subunit gamma [Parvibaculum lavamentivorans]A7HT51.1 RecName: Full=ATP synthase gamma chain; AltName: Full=ATP synthase F1 sector gamma subunit; AltName: Full=F-ATPase gamma subunit [Parvibaculum lavamentivorans DS-1]ABS63084.1 ATP synthase F1, gamma subunit [Parvibaculum lavamentivorans DS-1]